MKKIFIKTFGCQMNIYDSNKIFNILNKFYNIKIVKKKKKANLIIINTCSIRQKTEEKIFSFLGTIYKIKKKKKNLIICLCGCMVFQKKYLKIRAPYIDIILNSQSLHKLPKLINKKLNHFKLNKYLLNKNKFNYFSIENKKSISSYITIIEGCNKFCSYCIIPYTRGIEKSRNITNILNEIYYLIYKNTKEIILLGQNINSFINFLKKKIDLSYLIMCISYIPEIKRIRFITSHPKNFNNKLINIYGKTRKLVNHLYLPIQHASDNILKSMKRDYTVKKYIKIIKKIRKIRPNISLSSDFIIGFPGESKNDFNKLIKLVKKIKFDISYSFIFSPRPKTEAYKFENSIPYFTKLKRLKKLQKIIKKNVNFYNKKMIFTKQNILIEKKINNIKIQGRTENNRIVLLNYNHNFKKIIGKIIKVKIINKLKFYFNGKIV